MAPAPRTRRWQRSEQRAGEDQEGAGDWPRPRDVELPAGTRHHAGDGSMLTTLVRVYWMLTWKPRLAAIAKGGTRLPFRCHGLVGRALRVPGVTACITLVVS